MFNRNTSFLALALLIPATAIHANKPQTIGAKIGHTIVQTINKHPYLSSFILGVCISDHEVPFLLTWLGGGLLTETATNAIMNNFNIDKAQ